VVSLDVAIFVLLRLSGFLSLKLSITKNLHQIDILDILVQYSFLSNTALTGKMYAEQVFIFVQQ